MTILDLRPPLHDENKTNGVRFTLVSELLGAVLANQDEEILVEAKSRKLMYDRGRGVETGQALEVEIGWEKVEETDQEIGIRLSGIVKNYLNQESTFTLYFFMWWDYSNIPFIAKGRKLRRKDWNEIVDNKGWE